MADRPQATSSKSRTKNPDYFDYKDIKTLRRYLNTFGQIESRRGTNLSNKQQHRLAKAIKRARHLALLPYELR